MLYFLCPCSFYTQHDNANFFLCFVSFSEKKMFKYAFLQGKCCLLFAAGKSVYSFSQTPIAKWTLPIIRFYPIATLPCYRVSACPVQMKVIFQYFPTRNCFLLILDPITKLYLVVMRNRKT